MKKGYESWWVEDTLFSRKGAALIKHIIPGR